MAQTAPPAQWSEARGQTSGGLQSTDTVALRSKDQVKPVRGPCVQCMRWRESEGRGGKHAARCGTADSGPVGLAAGPYEPPPLFSPRTTTAASGHLGTESAIQIIAL
eukprot:364818-Chlamydomonas_euryale.AAC.10